ncbi:MULTISPECIES: 16S rRNA (cytidine(1402)-2'-O)-methyltransferase [Psychrobacillus]|uniref:Ribosomal RNA small subunit methyltransferase I n=1 Tax=Psychrobacillus faecigallinarum TaxID=2762235 RepID=A0ABR8REU2_9BACI|nr:MULTISPECIES: 16S rRNA (cytidine(1402)-2'-O)-methyltransferase [Psychrobacillus]MBD7946281.1 16S rRNA (cytidine(1402)-2'-O)-methyltransferase [Psychrobacillus faecigallinarum]QEY21358.1 16S rRNA (cytidine(1402)-2'-O)-methyltransferase [Psychrobacillus sp. AK 1817]
MKSQKSTEHEQSSCLYLVATPIGNLEDMTMRAIRILKEVDYIAAEDTRNSKKLCNYFEISTPLMSYHDHNQQVGGEKILEILREGKQVALVSDAGLPCISDPGADIAAKAIDEGFAVVPVPGANAALSALIASGMSTQPFFFYGFLSRNKKERKKEITLLQKRQETILLYEAPHRLKDTLKDIQAIMEGSRRIVLARELTKKFEEFLRGTVEEALEWAESNEIRGEFCIVLEGNDTEEVLEEEAWWINLSIEEHVEHLMNEKQLKSKEAIKEVAIQRGLSKREVYQSYHVT